MIKRIFNKKGFHTLLEPFISLMEKDFRVKDSWEPPVDIYETDDFYCVIAELPGVAKENMKLYIDGRKLIISGEKKVCFDENSVKGKLNFYRIERPLGFFKREIVLPSYVEAVNNMNVKYKDGLLEIFLNKTKKRIIKVE